MVMIKRRYRVIAGALALLALLIFCGTPFQQAAQAIVGVDDALIGIVIAGLAAVGITFVSTGAYNSLTEYVGSLLDQYAGTMGTTGQGLFSGVQTGANSLGQILINNRMVRLISAFATWIKYEFGLMNNNDIVVQSAKEGLYIGNIKLYNFPIILRTTLNNGSGTSGNPNYVYSILTADSEAYCAFRQSGNSIIGTVIALDSCTVHEYRWYGTTSMEYNHNCTLQNNGYYIYTLGSVDSRYYPVDFEMTYSSEELDAHPNVGNPIDGYNQAEIGISTGVITPPLDDSEYDDGDGAVIDVAAPWGMVYPDIVYEWLPKEWAPGMSGNPSITYDTAPAIDEQVQTGPETVQVSSNPSEYTVSGLQSVFPFCIPFDMYSFFECLAADPVAPEISWRFYVPGICDEQIEIDLSQFDTVAQIVRTMELLAFIVGLALVTREKFLRG